MLWVDMGDAESMEANFDPMCPHEDQTNNPKEGILIHRNETQPFERIAGGQNLHLPFFQPRNP